MSNFIIDVDKNKMDDIVSKTEDNSSYFTDISDNIVKSYTGDLDLLMKDMYQDTVANEASDVVLEKYVLELNNMLYFLGDKLESVGIKDDLSKMAAKEVYNAAYLSNQVKDTDKRNKTTVAELTALAEDASRYDAVMNSIYSRAYKQIKYKVDSGYEMLNSLRKIITKRMQDSQLSMYQPKPFLKDEYTSNNM